MAKRQHTTPMLVSGDEAVRLRRVRFDERAFDEGWLQDLLFRYPHLIPVDEIEPAFSPLIPLAREVPTHSGSLDLLYVNPDGYPTLVETKLWRNPEARRQVVAQIIDYAKEFATWSYEDLVEAIRRGHAACEAGDPVWAAVQGEEDIDQRAFTDALSRNLSLGRFLLLIVGDGIREGMERMAAYLQRTPSLQFTLVLVEMATYRLDADKDEPLLVQPRIVARTQEVIRAVVRFEGEAPPGTKISVEVPSEADRGGGRRTTITEEEFYQALRRSPYGGDEAVAFAQEVLAELRDSEITIEWLQGGPSLKYISETGHRFSLGTLQKSGVVDYIGTMRGQIERAGIPPEIGREYAQTFLDWIPGTTLSRGGGLLHRGRYQHRPHMRDLVPHKDAWLRLMQETVAKIKRALGEED